MPFPERSTQTLGGGRGRDYYVELSSLFIYILAFIYVCNTKPLCMIRFQTYACVLLVREIQVVPQVRLQRVEALLTCWVCGGSFSLYLTFVMEYI